MEEATAAEVARVVDAGRAGWVAPGPPGPGGNCICPNCGHREPHGVGQACYRKKCPECGSDMIRE